MTLGRVLAGVAIVWLAALLIIDKGPRWGIVIDLTEYPLGQSICVKGHLQAACWDINEETYKSCWMGAYWDDGRCVDRTNYPDSIPGATFGGTP